MYFYVYAFNFSRDKDGLNDYVQDDCIDLLLNYAALTEMPNKSAPNFDGWNNFFLYKALIIYT